MKATKLLLATAFFTGLATLTFAGPGPQYWARKNPAAPAAKPAATQATPTATMACAACKTAAIEEFKSTLPNGRPPFRWVTTGVKHDCFHCGGSITVVNGKTTDAMGRDCKMCTEGASFCCVPAPKASAMKS